MQKIFKIICIVLFVHTIQAQNIKGKVFIMVENEKKPLEFATIKQVKTNTGTFSDEKGYFELKINREISDSIEVSYIGYEKKYLKWNEKVNEIILEKTFQDFKEIEITAKKSSLELSTLQTMNVEKITLKEIKRAACCNLSESFETNATVDAKFSDALSGARQIQLLGLSGIYTQYLRENIPSLLGMQNAMGLAYVPGSWLSEISISKGIGSVINGMDGVAGSLNYELVKPECEDVAKKLLNVYAATDARLEANLIYPFEINPHLRMVTMLHGSGLYRKMDYNNDDFIDMPVYTQINALHRWDYFSKNETEFQGGIQFIHDNRQSGNDMMSSHEHFMYKYHTEIINKGVNVWTKLGKVHNADKNNSTGLQISGAWYNSYAKFDQRILDITDKTFLANLIHHRQLFNKKNEISLGANYLFFQRNGVFTFAYNNMKYADYAVFAEHNYTPNKKINIITGLRFDYFDAQAIITPRFHFKYNFNDDNIFRFSTGKSSRRSDIINDNFNLLSNNRIWKIENAYAMENAWTTGFNYTSKFKFNKIENSVRLDFYYTNFKNKSLVHYTKYFDSLYFFNEKNSAYAYSAQLEWQQIFNANIEYRMALRYEQSMEKWDSIWQNRILYSPLKYFTTLSLNTNNKKWKLDVTSVLYSKKWQMPKVMEENGMKYLIQSKSKSFCILNAQANLFLKHIELYIGVENILNFRQNEIIQNYNNPQSIRFNASNIWGTINGRQFYTGLRWTW